MGRWFSNLSIRRNGKIGISEVCEYICNAMASKQYIRVLNEDDADCSYAVVSAGDWFCVYSDWFSFDDPKMFASIATPASQALDADVLGLSCFDSDFLYLNLIRTSEQLDAWAGIGSASGLGLGRRTKLSSWKNKVDNFPAFQECMKKKYVFAEDVLSEIAENLHLPHENSVLAYEHLNELPSENMEYLHFKLPNELKTHEPPMLVHQVCSAEPYFPDKLHYVECVNKGGAAKGLSIYFIGPYVEKDELTFTDVELIAKRKGNEIRRSITLEKKQLQNGQWAYGYSDPKFQILAAPDQSLPMQKYIEELFKRGICVNFKVQGNPRKALDVFVIMEPRENPEGRMIWSVWLGDGSPKKYIQRHNESAQKWRQICPNNSSEIYNEEDFDLAYEVLMNTLLQDNRGARNGEALQR